MTYLCKLGPYAAHDVDVHQVWLCPERPQACRLQRFPPVDKEVKALMTVQGMNLQLKLPDG